MKALLLTLLLMPLSAQALPLLEWDMPHSGVPAGATSQVILGTDWLYAMALNDGFLVNFTRVKFRVLEDAYLTADWEGSDRSRAQVADIGRENYSEPYRSKNGPLQKIAFQTGEYELYVSTVNGSARLHMQAEPIPEPKSIVAFLAGLAVILYAGSRGRNPKPSLP